VKNVSDLQALKHALDLQVLVQGCGGSVRGHIPYRISSFLVLRLLVAGHSILHCNNDDNWWDCCIYSSLLGSFPLSLFITHLLGTINELIIP